MRSSQSLPPRRTSPSMASVWKRRAREPDQRHVEGAAAEVVDEDGCQIRGAAGGGLWNE